MEKPTKTIKLSNAEVDIFTAMTWGDKERIKGAFTTGFKVKADKDGKNPDMSFDMSSIQAANYIALEVMIKEIREGDKTFKFNRDWVDSLSVDDGDKLMNEIDAVTNLDKKKLT